MGESKDGNNDSVAPVVIGMDPHKRTVTIEVMSASEQAVGHGRFTTDEAGFAAMVDYASRWAQRTWAIEGCEDIGRHVAQRLLPLQETVVDEPAKLSARMRVYATGQGRKTDATAALDRVS
jgi:transposase